MKDKIRKNMKDLSKTFNNSQKLRQSQTLPSVFK
jgi:hypothetical protein